MQKVQAYRVEIPIVTKDEYSAELNKASKAIKDVEQNAKKGVRAQDNLAKSGGNVAKSQTNISKSSNQASKGIENIGKSAEQTGRKASKASKLVESFGSRVKSLQRAKANVEIGVKDNASRTLTRVKSMYDGFKHAPLTRITVTAVDKAYGVLNGIRKAVISIPTMVSIGVGVIAGSKAFGMAKDGVNAAVEKGMHEELSTVTIGSMLRNEKMTERYMNFMKNLAQDSPVLDYGQMMDNSKYIIAQTKDIEQLEKSWRVIEKLQTLDPAQGTEGAAFALKEMFSGDAVSLVERFGFEKAWANEVKKMSVNKQLVEFEKQLAKMGIDDQTITDVAGTMHSQINQIKETLEDGTRSFGKGIITSTAPVMSKFNSWFETNADKWDKIKITAKQIGESVSKWTIDKLTDQASKLSKHLKLNDILDVLIGEGDGEPIPIETRFRVAWDMLSGNVKDYFNTNVKPAISEWWDGTGSEMAVDVGKSIGEGIIEGIKLGIKSGGQFIVASYKDLFSNIKENPFSVETSQSLLTAGIATAGAGYLGKKLVYNPVKTLGKGGKNVYNKSKKVTDWVEDRTGKRRNKFEQSNERRIERRKARAAKAREKTEAKKVKKEPGLGKLGFTSLAPNASFKSLGKIGSKLGGPLRALSLLSLTDGVSLSSLGEIGSGWAGAAAGGAAGAAIGSVVPGVGTVIGGVTGSIIGGLGGDALYSHFEDSLFNETWWSEKWNGIKEGASATLFNGEWWSGKWNSTKEFATSTFFSASWWGEQAGLVWGTLDTTLFSGEWWSGKWDGVKGWTSQKFDEWNEIYDNVTSKISETIFNSEWWSGKWAETKSWAETTIDGFSNVWSNALSSAESTLFSSEWWSGKWAQVKSWASGAWENIKSGFNVGYDKGAKQTYGPPAPQVKYAKGGIATSPHIGLVAEAGVPEAMIPWDGSNRSKMLWQQTGEALGMFGNMATSQGGQSAIQASALSNGGGMTINFGDITVGQASNLSAEGILDMIMPILYQHIQAALDKR